MDLNADLQRRGLPPLRSREEMKEILCREVYGDLPQADYSLSVSAPVPGEARFCCGTVEASSVDLTVKVGRRSHTFRVGRLLHKSGTHPLVVLANFHPMESSIYFPMEELAESDADFLVFHYRDVTSDDGDFSTGLAPLLLPDGQSTDRTCGKIGIWAWAAMRVLDYGLTLPGTDPEYTAVAGHSRLGKTALYAGMNDERFRFVFSNAAGCAGDSLAHGNSGLTRTGRISETGELISDITAHFPYWFCRNYFKYAARNVAEEFDQHFLLATIAPRYVIVGSCDLDGWADPRSQQVCALAAGKMWESFGLPGLIGGKTEADAGQGLTDGCVGYFKIHSHHFLSRHSWRFFLEFLEKHRRGI